MAEPEREGSTVLPTLGGRYEAVELIATGGMGSVYLARVEGSDRPVAIKLLHPHLADDPQVVAMFVDEARVATRIRHPNVVTVSDVSLVGGELRIVMEYVEGVPLHWLQRDLFALGRPLDVALTTRILGDALDGLHAAHELRDANGEPLGLVHRDVSPQNLLVGVDGITRVTDFGVALSEGRIASTAPSAPVKGKVQYLAPEQIRRRGTLDRRVDVFAAGIVLWECLTGTTLFGDGTEAETIARVLRDPIAPPSTHRPDIPAALDDVCLRALERDPERRYATAADLAEALRAACPPMPANEVGAMVLDVCGDPIRARREALARPVARASAAKRSPGARPLRLYALTATAALLALAVVALGVALLRKKAAEVDYEIVDIPAEVAPAASGAPPVMPPEPRPASASGASAAPEKADLPAKREPNEHRGVPPRHAPRDAGQLFMPGHL